jgi:hypothetical protein
LESSYVSNISETSLSFFSIVGIGVVGGIRDGVAGISTLLSHL